MKKNSIFWKAAYSSILTPFRLPCHQISNKCHNHHITNPQCFFDLLSKSLTNSIKKYMLRIWAPKTNQQFLLHALPLNTPNNVGSLFLCVTKPYNKYDYQTYGNVCHFFPLRRLTVRNTVFFSLSENSSFIVILSSHHPSIQTWPLRWWYNYNDN